ncbi:MAG: hypothetical protein AAF226_05895 [Verrucomicrobiota bacterium]
MSRSPWQQVAGGGLGRQTRDYLQPDGYSTSREVMAFLNYPGSLVAPAVDWARSRLDMGHAAMGTLEDRNLWLMSEGVVRKISLDLPVASSHYKASGAYLGQSHGNLWFLSSSGLQQIDSGRNKTRMLVVDEIGEAGSIRGTVSGERVYLTGSNGYRVFHARTGGVISQGAWPEELIAYLAAQRGNKEPDIRSGYQWQGQMLQASGNAPTYCFPASVSVTADQVITIFNQRSIVAISSK